MRKENQPGNNSEMCLQLVKIMTRKHDSYSYTHTPTHTHTHPHTHRHTHRHRHTHIDTHTHPHTHTHTPTIDTHTHTQTHTEVIYTRQILVEKDKRDSNLLRRQLHAQLSAGLIDASL